MADQNFPDDVLYEMDNLPVLRGMNSETVDLIATDPPFNTGRNRSGTAGEYEDAWKWGDMNKRPDQWKWTDVHPIWLEEIKDDNPALYEVIQATRVCHDEDTAAFLCFLSVRLLEMHRVLKPTGSIYLHCDHTANAYIRMCMDAIFGKKNFRNEIVWAYRTGVASRHYWSRKHDTLLFYVKSDAYAHNPVQERIYYNRPFFTTETDAEGRYYADVYVRDVWDDIKPLINVSRERTGSPDQKPLALYERIIKASSNEGNLVLDPFCGCATTIIAARDLNRRWVGVDRRTDARYHVVYRMANIDQKERERLEGSPGFEDWVQAQMARHEARYHTEKPTRTDTGDTASPSLPSIFPVAREYELSHEQMRDILIEQFGVKCWGCNFAPPRKEYLQLDHITPRTDGGSNQLDNRALLCSPCNMKKSNKLTLSGLRRANKKDKHLIKTEESINLRAAAEWTRQFMTDRIRNVPHQYNLDGR